MQEKVKKLNNLLTLQLISNMYSVQKNPENTRKEKDRAQPTVQKQYFGLYTHANFVYECVGT